MKLYFLILLVLFGCVDNSEQLVVWSGKTMGTTYSIKFTQSPDGPALPSQEEVDKLLVAVNNAMSTYIPSSEISVINKSAKKNVPYQISEDFAEVLKLSLDVAKKTNGIFDPSIGPLVNLWGFGPEGKRKVPSQSAIEEARSRVGYKKVVLSRPTSKVMFLQEGMYLDLSASAKGFGVDKIANFLLQRRIKNFMVEIGGEVRTHGMNNSKAWRIGIETPELDFNNRSVNKVVELSGLSLATSGNYRNFFEEKGKKYSHTMNYFTGEPVKGVLASVTVISKDGCMDADAWATALMAMGYKKAIEYSKKFNISAYLIYAPHGSIQGKFETFESPEFMRLLAAKAK